MPDVPCGLGEAPAAEAGSPAPTQKSRSRPPLLRAFRETSGRRRGRAVQTFTDSPQRAMGSSRPVLCGRVSGEVQALSTRGPSRPRHSSARLEQRSSGTPPGRGGGAAARASPVCGLRSNSRPGAANCERPEPAGRAGPRRGAADQRRAPPGAGQWERRVHLKTRAGGGAGLRLRGAVRWAGGLLGQRRRRRRP